MFRDIDAIQQTNAKRPTVSARFFLYDPESDSQEFRAQTHDYDPSWDYECIAIPKNDPNDNFARMLASSMERIDREIFGLLEIYKAMIFVSNFSGQNHVGIYIRGTGSEEPVIGINLTEIQINHDEFLVDGSEEILVTILHELGHAYLSDLENMDSDAEEEIVERCARSYAKTDNTDAFLPLIAFRNTKLADIAEPDSSPRP